MRWGLWPPEIETEHCGCAGLAATAYHLLCLMAVDCEVSLCNSSSLYVFVTLFCWLSAVGRIVQIRW